MAIQVDLPVRVRVDLDVRVRVGDGEWLSVGSGQAEGDSAEAISQTLAEALRELASAVERADEDAGPTS